MVLLPSGSFTTAPWSDVLESSSLSPEQKSTLWESILLEISSASSSRLTHLAINEGIPLRVASVSHGEEDRNEGEQDNLLRSPSGLKMLHGDFGPADVAPSPTQADYGAAFWVSTKQNGITQIWAPRWTMFSRGNVKEKARLLAFHSDNNEQKQQQKRDENVTRLDHRQRPARDLKGKYAIDLYAGIGYFVFSYAKLGMRALCWELNPWSVEGLRRGAEANRWSVRVIDGEALKVPAAKLVSDLKEQIVVFLEDNMCAERRVSDLRAAGLDLDVMHINCGFLPSSENTWRSACRIQTQGPGRDGWLHLHENVGVADIESRRVEIQKTFERWRDEEVEGSADVTAFAEHAELVKTFAPDVWHCVFDVYITRTGAANESPCPT